MKKLNVVFVVTIAILLITGGIARAADTPAQVYAKYNKALKAGNFDEMLTYISKKQVANLQKYSEEEKQKMFKFLQTSAPEEYQVLKTDVSESSATLHLKGKVLNPFDGQAKMSTGKVKFVKEDGNWKIDKEHWATGKAIDS